MQSKNKPAPKKRERAHIERIKSMPCAVCEQPGPSECHEIEQGLWFVSIPLCESCHRGPLLGLHGQARAWSVRKMDEMDALAKIIEKLLYEAPAHS